VTLSDTRGNAVLDTIAEGPIFYARVPASASQQMRAAE